MAYLLRRLQVDISSAKVVSARATELKARRTYFQGLLYAGKAHPYPCWCDVLLSKPPQDRELSGISTPIINPSTPLLP